MSMTIDQAFITQFEADVHMAYQQRGSKLRNTCRIRTGVSGEKVRFQKAGKGTAQQKTRHGKVPVMNAVHSYVEATLEDWYGGDWVDRLDLLKTNIDERNIQVNTGAWALGRKVDSLIVTQLDATTTTVAEGAAGLTKGKVLEAFEDLNDKDVPDDGLRFGPVGAHQWNELLNLSEFKSADYIGASQLPWISGTEAKRWLNIIWMMHSGLPLSAGTRKVFLYHKTGIGLAEALNVTTDITWHGDYAAWFVNNMLSAGSKLIDVEGVVEISCDDDAAIS